MWEERLSEFVTFFLVVNPVGVVPVYLALVGKIGARIQRKIALDAAIAAFGVLVFFLFAGELLLD